MSDFDFGYIERRDVLTVFLQLSSVWSAPTGCSTQFYSAVNNGPVFTGTAFDPWYDQHWGSYTCQPPAATSWWQQVTKADFTSNTVTSLGPVVCPDLYTVGGSSVIIPGASTLIGCCPTSYTMVSIATDLHPNLNAMQQCTSALTDGQVVTYFEQGGSNSGTQKPVTSTMTGTENVIHALPINGYSGGVFGGMATSTSTSVASISSQSTSSIPTSTSTSSIPTPTSTSTSENNTPTSNSSKGFSSGVTVGIGIGVTFGVLGLCALVAAIFITRRPRHNPQIDISTASKIHNSGYTEFYTSDGYPRHQREGHYELGNEMGNWKNSTEPQELNGMPVDTKK